jgi:hypothetical protein
MKPAVPLLLLLLVPLASCVDLPDEQPVRAATADPSDRLELEALLSVPIVITCREALVAISPDLRPLVTLTGAFAEHAHGARGQRVHLRYRELQLDCERFELVVQQDGHERFLLVASGAARSLRLASTVTAETIEIGPDGMSTHGATHVEIDWAPPAQRPDANR